MQHLIVGPASLNDELEALALSAKQDALTQLRAHLAAENAVAASQGVLLQERQQARTTVEQQAVELRLKLQLFVNQQQDATERRTQEQAAAQQAAAMLKTQQQTLQVDMTAHQQKLAALLHETADLTSRRDQLEVGDSAGVMLQLQHQLSEVEGGLTLAKQNIVALREQRATLKKANKDKASAVKSLAKKVSAAERAAAIATAQVTNMQQQHQETQQQRSKEFFELQDATKIVQVDLATASAKMAVAKQSLQDKENRNLTAQQLLQADIVVFTQRNQETTAQIEVRRSNTSRLAKQHAQSSTKMHQELALARQKLQQLNCAVVDHTGIVEAQKLHSLGVFKVGSADGLKIFPST
jgi:hypothetical protein